MTNRSKQKGTTFESLIEDYLVEEWDDRIVRQPQSGIKDLGDIANFRVGNHKVALECKNVRVLNLAGWVGEAQDEAKNLGAVAGVVIHKRTGKGRAGDQYVTCTLHDFINLLHAATRP